MPIPDFQKIMLPLLLLSGDGREHSFSDAVDAMADEFQLTPYEIAERLPSGKYPRFRQRVGWAKTYLSKAGLLDNPKRGALQITQEGRKVLAASPPMIDKKYLQQFASFIEFQHKTGAESETSIPQAASELTPRESLETAYQQLRETLALELLERVKANSPEFFEQLVLDLLLAMGYGGSRPDAGRAVGRSGDGGIDGLINEDPLGLDVVYVQAKRWEGVVGRPVVQAFVGSLEGQRARKGVMITTSSFTTEATQYVGMIDKKVILIDGSRLAELMIEHGVGVTVEQTYLIKRLDLDYYDDQGP